MEAVLSTDPHSFLSQNQQKAMEIDFSFICVLIAAVVIVTGVSLFYLSERAQLMEQRSALSDKKEQLNALLVENENLNLEIEQSINLDEIEKTAKQYGMKEAFRRVDLKTG